MIKQLHKCLQCGGALKSGVKSQGKALKFKEKRFLEEEGICRYRRGELQGDCDSSSPGGQRCFVSGSAQEDRRPLGNTQH